MLNAGTASLSIAEDHLVTKPVEWAQVASNEDGYTMFSRFRPRNNDQSTLLYYEF